MTKRIIGIFGSLAVIAVMVLAIMGRQSYSSAIVFGKQAAEMPATIEVEVVAEPQAEASVEQVATEMPDTTAVDAVKVE